MYKKITMFKKVLCLESIHEKILLACSSGPTVQAVSVKFCLCPKMVSKKFCPKNLFAILAKFSSICEIFAMFKKNSMSLKYLKRIGYFKVFGLFLGCFINTDFFWTYSLSKWSNYPNSILEILAMFKKNSMALKYLKRIGQFKVFGFFHGYLKNLTKK